MHSSGLYLRRNDVRLNNAEYDEAMIDSGKLPFNQLPIVELNDGTVLVHSYSIMRLYIGKFTGLYPIHDPIKCAIIDSMLIHEEETIITYVICRYPRKICFYSLYSLKV